MSFARSTSHVHIQRSAFFFVLFQVIASYHKSDDQQNQHPTTQSITSNHDPGQKFLAALVQLEVNHETGLAPLNAVRRSEKKARRAESGSGSQFFPTLISDFLLWLFGAQAVAHSNSKTLAGSTADKSKPAPTFEPLNPAAENITDFALTPPTELAQSATLDQNPTLGGVGVTTQAMGVRVHQNYLSATGRDFTVSNAVGHYLYASHGQWLTMHSHTYIYDAATGVKFAMIIRLRLAAHWMYEIYSYEPAYQNQPVADEIDVGNVTLYNYARLTKTMLALYDYWTLERYVCCDGTRIAFWEVYERYYLQALDHYDVREPGGALPIGTMDQTWYLQMTSNYDAWVTKGVDLQLFCALALLLDINRQHSKSGGGGSSGGGGAAGGGGGGGGGASAR